jgi:predicted nucleic acid-binding protein
MMLKPDAAVNVSSQTVSKCLPDAEELISVRRVGHVITAIFGMNDADFLTYYVLRTFDALHLASAVLLSEQLTAFVAYDHRLTGAARTAGLIVATPGRP